jgi:hypothetical protein
MTLHSADGGAQNAAGRHQLPNLPFHNSWGSIFAARLHAVAQEK